MMKMIAIHTTAWKRMEVTRIAWKALNRVREQFREHGYDSFVVVGVSEPAHHELAAEFGFKSVNVQNKPVGYKFNRTARHILQMKVPFDYFMEYCSDNILSEDYVPKAVALLEDGKDYIAMNQFYICDMPSGEVRTFGTPETKKGGISNVGRITAAKHVIRTWRKTGMLYDIRANRRLDRSFHMNLYHLWRIEPHIIKTEHPLIVDLKDDDSMNKYKGFEVFEGRFPLSSVVGKFPELPAKFDTHKNQPSWHPSEPQEKSEVTLSEFTSPQLKETAASQTTHSEATATQSETPSVTPPPKAKRSSSSRQRRRAASQEAGTSSTPPQKTTTDDAKS